MKFLVAALWCVGCGSGAPNADLGSADLGSNADLGDSCFDRGPDELPARLGCTSLWTDVATKTLAGGVVAYTPGLALWSDGADKSRYLYLPPSSQIDTSDLDEWRFPVGTRAWKEFRVGGARIETRIFWKRGPSDWAWSTYRWRADGMDADRLETGALNVVGTYEIPTQDACASCHGGRKDKLLGVEAISLALPAATGITLTTLVADGRLTAPPAHTNCTLPEDTTGKAAAALGTLHVNCGTTCHNRNSSAGAYFSALFLRLPAASVLDGTATVPVLDSWTTSNNVTPTSADFSSYTTQGYKRLWPQHADKSLIPKLAGQRIPGQQMPPIVTHEVDTVGVKAVSDWINAL